MWTTCPRLSLRRAAAALGLFAAVVPVSAGDGSESLPAGDVVRTADVRALALGIERGSGRLVAVGARITDPAAVGVHWIDPDTGSVEQTLPLGFIPETAAFSDDGAVAYVAAGSTIARVDLVARRVTQTFGAGTVPGRPQVDCTVGELSVPPGAHDTVVAARRDPSRWPDPYAGIAVFDAGVARPAVSVGDDIPVERFESLATDVGVAYVVSYPSEAPRLRRIDVVPEGAFDAAQSAGGTASSGFYGRLHVASGRLVADWGGEADAATLEFLPRRWIAGDAAIYEGASHVTGAVLPDTAAGRVYVLDPPVLEMRAFPGGDWLGSVRYAQSAAPSWQAVPRADLVRLGEGRFAFATWDGVVVLQTGFTARPTGLTATASVGGMPPVSLSWSDNSPDEATFTIERRRDAGDWMQAATVAADVTSWLDPLAGALVTGSTYAYRVCANRPAGPSAWSDEASATLHEELEFSLMSGLVRDARGRHRDRVVVVGKLYPRRSDYDIDWRARRVGAEVTIRTGANTIRATAPAGSSRWKRQTIQGLAFDVYRSPPGQSPAFAFACSPRRRYVVFVASGFDLAGTAANPVSVHVRLGADACLTSRDWKPDRGRGLRTGRRIRGI
jgi:hypothetical protein